MSNPNWNDQVVPSKEPSKSKIQVPGGKEVKDKNPAIKQVEKKPLDVKTNAPGFSETVPPSKGD